MTSDISINFWLFLAQFGIVFIGFTAILENLWKGKAWHKPGMFGTLFIFHHCIALLASAVLTSFFFITMTKNVAHVLSNLFLLIFLFSAWLVQFESLRKIGSLKPDLDHWKLKYLYLFPNFLMMMAVAANIMLHNDLLLSLGLVCLLTNVVVQFMMSISKYDKIHLEWSSSMETGELDDESLVRDLAARRKISDAARIANDCSETAPGRR